MLEQYGKLVGEAKRGGHNMMPQNESSGEELLRVINEWTWAEARYRRVLAESAFILLISLTLFFLLVFWVVS